MKLTLSAKKTVAISFILALALSLFLSLITKSILSRSSVRQQLASSSSAVVEKIISDFTEQFLSRTKYIASEIDSEKENISTQDLQKIMENLNAEEITVTDDDGAVLISCGKKTYDKSFNAKFDPDFRPVLKKLFADNEAVSYFDKISGTNLICAGKMAHGGAVFIRYPSEQLEYLLLAHPTNFAYTFTIRRTGYILIFDDHGTIISDMYGGGSYGNPATKIGFKKTKGVTNVKEGVLCSDKIHGKSSYFTARRFDGYTIISVLPKKEAASVLYMFWVISAIINTIVLISLFIFIIFFIEKSNSAENENEEPEHYDIMQTAAKAAKLALSMLGKKEISFIVQIDPELNTEFYGNRAEIEAIINCLVQNSAHFTAKGMIALRIENVGELKITVVDTGVGIKKENLENLRLDFNEIPDKHRYKSFSLARKIIRNMGGSFQINSQYSKGSAFTVFLPYNPACDEKCKTVYGQILDEARFDAKRSNLKNISGAKLTQILHE